MEALQPIWSFNISGLTFNITLYLVVQWIIILAIALLSLYLTRDLKEVPSGKQNVLEMFVESIYDLIRENMGKGYENFGPYIGTLALYLLTMNMMGLFGIAPPTKDYSVDISLALISFVVIQGYAIKKVGLGHYFTGYGKPFLVMLPLNVMERFMLPISLSLRLFGNMLSATIIIELVYDALSHISWFAQLIVPVPLHFYFDIFDGAIQMIIFVMLTMINIKLVSEH